METFWKQSEEYETYLTNDKKYLCNINGYYYFSFRYEKRIIKVSLKTKDLIQANKLKTQLIRRLNMNDELEKKFTLNNSVYGINTFSHKDEDPDKIKELNAKILDLINEAHKKGDIKTVEFTNETVKKISIKDAYEDFMNDKKNIDKLRDSSVRKYNTHFKYLLMFCEEDKLVYTFTNQFFKDIQKKIQVFPSNTLKLSKYKNKKYDEIMEDFKNIDYKRLSNKSINEIFKSFNQMFEHFSFADYISENTVEYKTLNETTEKYVNFSDNEIEYFLKNSDNPFLTHIFRIGLYTGMRVGEIAQLKKQHIDFDKQIITIDFSKTPSGLRVIPIHNDIVEIFKFYYCNPIDDFLFIKNGNKNILTKKMGKEIRKYFTDSKKVFHSTRKNLAIELYKFEQKNQIKETTIKRIMGHDTSDNITFDVYNLNKVDIEVLRNAIDKVNYECLKDIPIGLPNISIKSNKSSVNLTF